MKRVAIAILSGLFSIAAFGQFAASVQPARFEYSAKPGETIRDMIEIGNDELAPMEVTVRTSDWTLRPDGGVDFRTDSLAPDSCRPWVRIERFSVKVAGKAKRRFRFEVQVPADAKPGLCRFALLIEPGGIGANISPLDNIKMPLQGRIGVIVYVRLGNAAPLLTLEKVTLGQVSGRPVPMAWLRNSGNAQGRVEGVLVATDAKGEKFDLTVSPLPILPGETRAIAMWPPETKDRKAPEFARPLRVTGTMDWEGGEIPVEAEIR
jgi:fimbrial chaperone protein